MSVTLEHVTRTVDGLPTIRDVSLTLERGTLSVLLGPTLSGKTSIMRRLAGLDRPTTGRVLVEGKDVTGFDVDERGYQVGHRMVTIQWQEGRQVVVWPEAVATGRIRFPTPPWSQR